MKNFNKDDVSASLEQGILLHGKTKFTVWFCFCSSLLMPLVTIGIIATINLGYMSWDADTIFTIIAANCFSGLLLVLSLFFMIKDRILKKKVDRWIQDAVPVEATLKRIENYRALENPYRIIVKFIFNGKEYSYKSEKSNFVKGFSKYYLKYCLTHKGKTMVLYSPTYNQVLLLKK